MPLNVPCSVKRGLHASAKSIGSGQPARTAQADLSRYVFATPYMSTDYFPSGISFVADPHSAVNSVRQGGRCFDSRLGQYSFRGLTIVITTGFVPLSPLSVVSTMVLWESSQWLGKNIVQSSG